MKCVKEFVIKIERVVFHDFPHDLPSRFTVTIYLHDSPVTCPLNRAPS